MQVFDLRRICVTEVEVIGQLNCAVRGKNRTMPDDLHSSGMRKCISARSSVDQPGLSKVH